METIELFHYFNYTVIISENVDDEITNILFPEPGRVGTGKGWSITD